MHALTRRFIAIPCLVSIAFIAGCKGGTTDPVQTTRAVTAAKTGTGGGTVVSTPAGIICGNTCSAALTSQTAISFSATPDTNATFVSWSGACSGTSAACSVPADVSAANVSARFDLKLYTLTVALAGTGTGTVASTPAGIACGADCSEPYTSGTVVTLTATPGASSTFTGWSGGLCTGTATCVVTANQVATVTATFTTAAQALTVTFAGNGGGTVTSAPAGVNCTATCNANFNINTIVTLTAAANATSTFTGWTGSGCTGTAACVVTLAQAANVTATFALQTRALTAALAGNGTGTVTSAPAGINCGATCTANYNVGTVVTLTAAPAVSSTFTGWSGACAGTGTCVVTTNQASTATATFTLLTNTLTITRAGAGTGTVTSTPAGIACGATCAAPFNYGTAVTLVAAADATAMFSGWSGACTGTGQCVVTTNAASAVTATFDVFQARWPDSETRYCTDLTAAVACPGGVAGQDGNYAINVPTYEVVAGHVRDSMTGLIWERALVATQITQAAALTYCDNLTLDGFTDWRLPSYLEMASIADFGRVGPPFPTTAFPGIPQNSLFWTTGERTGSPGFALTMNTNYAIMRYSDKTITTDRLARCVRGAPLTGALTVAGGSVTDGKTQLVWQSGIGPTDMTWPNALAYCEALVLDGRSDWRLPSGKELMSIVDLTAPGAAISTLFAARPNTLFWSSSIPANTPTQAYPLNFDDGSSDGISQLFASLRAVRCVR